MKNAMWKTTFREIKQSLGRFLAILAIVALGVGLFAGLKVTKPFMLETMSGYLEEKQFYDFRLLSSYGFEQEDVEYLAAQPEARAVQGSFTYDVLYEYGASDATGVMKVHSLTEGVNELEVLEGRLPEAANECVVDSRLYGEEAIGETIRLSQENEEDTLEKFAQKEFTVVGVVQSSYYIQFERGNTSLGTGKVDSFLYVRPEAFDSEVYTEIFVKLDKDFPLYSQEYDDYIEEQEQLWEEYLQIAVDRRFQDIVEEANEELADAREEFLQEKADAEKELSDAKQELTDAAIEIADGKQEIEDGKKEIQDGYAELADAEAELLDGERELQEQERTLLAREKELEDGIQAWNDNNYAVESKKGELGEAEKQIAASEELLAQREAELKASEEQLLAQKTQLETVEAQLDAQEQTLTEKEAELLAQEQQLIAAFGQVPEEYAAAIEEGRTQIAQGKAEITAAREQVTAGKAQLEPYLQQIEQGRVELEAAKAQLAASKLQLEEGNKQLAEADKELAKAWEEIEDGKAQLEEGKQKIADAKKELEEGKKEIADARQELADAEKEIADAEVELADGEQEYEDGLQEYEDGVEEFNKEIADAESELADAQKEIDELEEPDSYILGRDTNVGYVCLESDSCIVEDVSDVFPVFFFLVAALVCMTTMNRMIEEQRTQIGVLKALGYSNATIMCKYLFYSGSAALLGCISGFFVGTFLFPKVIWFAYGMMYDGVSMVYYMEWKLAAISLVVSLLCSMGVTWYSCRVELNEVAASLMRPKAPKAGKRIFLERIPFIWRHLKFLQKVSIRNVLRYKRRFFMMVIGISGCTSLLVAAFGIKDSIADVASMQYQEIQLYDVSVTFTEAPDAEEYQEFEELVDGRIGSHAMFMEGSLDIQANGYTKSISLVVPQEPDTVESYLDLHTLDGEHIAFPGENEAVITHKLAENFELQVGDTVELVDEDHNTFTVTISGINQNFVYNYVYLHPDTCSKLWKEPEYKTAYLNLHEVGGEDVHLLSADIMKLETIANVTINEDVQERFESMMSSMNYIVLLIILCAAALAFIVLYNLTNINITERVREIATIKVLGFYKKETATYVFRENIMLTAIGAIAGLLLGKVFHAFVMSCINIDMVAFDVRVKGISYIYSIVLTLFFAWFVNRLMTGKLEKISMTESLKSVD